MLLRLEGETLHTDNALQCGGALQCGACDEHIVCGWLAPLCLAIRVLASALPEWRPCLHGSNACAVVA
jgi:hypothetical protein